MYIGNAFYNCSCVRYETNADIWLIVGITVGCFVILVLIITIVVVVCRRCRKGQTQQSKGREERIIVNNNENYAGSMELYEERYDVIGDGEPENDNAYCKPGPAEPEVNKEYSALGPPEPPARPSNTPYYISLKSDEACAKDST